MRVAECVDAGGMALLIPTPQVAVMRATAMDGGLRAMVDRGDHRGLQQRLFLWCGQPGMARLHQVS
jgi:hypothetical protein